MGKRVHKVLEEEEIIDQGLPGKIYFDKPQVINISSYRKNSIPEVDPINPRMNMGPEELYLQTTAVRLKSSHSLKVKGKDTLPDSVDYALSQRPTQEAATEYIRLNQINGFGEGAIVTRRFQEPWRHRWHGNWGMIVRIVGNVPIMATDPWAPYVIQWFERPDVPFEHGWSEDLILIHTSLSKDLLESILEAQDVPKPSGAR